MKAICSRCSGEKHNSTEKAAYKLCQDYCLAEPGGAFTVGIVSDGHGGERYFRSNIGAQYAAEAARDCIKEFIDKVDENLFCSECFTKRIATTAERASVLPRGSTTDKLFRQLFASIICRWHEKIEEHARNNPISAIEKESVSQENIKAFEKKDKLEITYGCTLVCFVQARNYWFAFHIGDGKCISFSADGSWDQPIPWDDSCISNTTTSLCDWNAIDEFRYCYGGKDTFPMAVFLGSDGIDGSFRDISDMANFYIEILKLISRSSKEEANKELDDTLPELSKKGSKDDMSVVCCYDERAVRESVGNLIKRQRDIVKDAMNDAIDRLDKLSRKRKSLDGLPALSVRDRAELDGCVREIGKSDEIIKKLRLKDAKLSYEQGDTHAPGKLARMYEKGDGTDKNLSEAFKWYRIAADYGEPDAQMSLAQMYEQGQGTEKNLHEAVKLYGMAAKQGNAPAQHHLGSMYEDGIGIGQNWGEALRWYREAAAKGLAASQLSLGSMYEKGRGVVQDFAEAEKWYRKSAETGDSEAQYILGTFYEYGKGVRQDDSEALKWYLKAAAQGNPKAQGHLGYMYRAGVGCEKDCTEAEKWCRKAAEHGNSAAQYRLGEIYLSGKGVKKDEDEAARWIQKAADQGNAEAQFKLGQMYQKGKGVEKNLVRAAELFGMAAENGNEEALGKLLKLRKGDTGFLSGILGG